MRVAHINVTSGLSTGRIAADICRVLQELGHRGLLCYSRGYPPEGVPSQRVGSRVDILLHALGARLFDRAGFFTAPPPGSLRAGLNATSRTWYTCTTCTGITWTYARCLTG
jgi:hypothetical protein